MKNNEKGFGHIEILLLVIIAGIISFVGWYVLHAKTTADSMLNKASNTQQVTQQKLKTPDAQALQAAKANSTSKTPGSAAPTTSQKITSQSKSSTTSPPPAPSPTPPTNTANCLPPNPSIYATYYIGMTNSQYLQTNTYVTTAKLYAALQFAGLIDTINTKQYVVLAMGDSTWDQFSQSQLNWMNASPSNMRSVLGWQIITSCITWAGVNPVNGLKSDATFSVNTLNGPTTFSFGTSGHGQFGDGEVGIWDWFTSNGSVTIAGFVNISSIP